MKTISYLGPENTHTYFAAKKKFGSKAKYVHAPTVEDVFQAVEREQADFGVVPIENSLEGAVTRTLDRFLDFRQSPVRIYGEIDQPIQHHLIMRKETPEDDIHIIYSHPQAFAQCRHWLEKHYSRAVRRERDSTADAIKDLLDEKEKSWDLNARAAIGRLELAEDNDLKSIPIPVERENRTRFLIISLRVPKRGGRSKTSLMVALKDKPGALHDTLVPFKNNRINLTKIESRPSKEKVWEYIFFIDFEGHESDLRVKKTLEALKRSVTVLRVLGSYPVGGVRGRR